MTLFLFHFPIAHGPQQMARSLQAVPTKSMLAGTHGTTSNRPYTACLSSYPCDRNLHEKTVQNHERKCLPVDQFFKILAVNACYLRASRADPF
jgi:hypothetical protein